MNDLLGTTLSVRAPDGTVTRLALAAAPATYAAEWGFVLQNARTIDRYAAKLSTDRRVDADDLRQEAIVWIVRLYGGFDPQRASAATWIYFLVRRARQALLDRLNRRDRHETSFDPSAIVHGDLGASAHAIEQKVLVSQVLARSPDASRIAAEAVLLDRADARTRRALPTLTP